MKEAAHSDLQFYQSVATMHQGNSLDQLRRRRWGCRHVDAHSVTAIAIEAVSMTWARLWLVLASIACMHAAAHQYTRQ